MSTSTVASNTVDERAVLRQLTWIHAKRYATHPLFIIGVVLLLVGFAAIANDAPTDPSTFAAAGWQAAFLLGVLGLVVSYRLTRTEDRALALLPSTPVSASTRTLALLGACLVPAAAALGYLLLRLVAYTVWAPYPGLVDAIGGPGVAAVVLLDGIVIASFGGPALGVAAARWLRFPGAGVLVAVLLTVIVAVASGAASQTDAGEGAREDVVALQAAATTMPWTSYAVVTCEGGGETGEQFGCELAAVRDGSQVGHMLYAFFLSGLACWAAMIRVAEGAVRRRWVSIGWICAIGASLSLTWALFG